MTRMGSGETRTVFTRGHELVRGKGLALWSGLRAGAFDVDGVADHRSLLVRVDHDLGQEPVGPCTSHRVFARSAGEMPLLDFCFGDLHDRHVREVQHWSGRALHLAVNPVLE